jgi:hypothetical protein
MTIEGSSTPIVRPLLVVSLLTALALSAASPAQAQGLLDTLKREAERALREAGRTTSNPSAPPPAGRPSAHEPTGATNPGASDALGGTEPATEPAATARPSAGFGPDVMGLRLGMTEDEVRNRMRSVLPSAKPAVLTISMEAGDPRGGVAGRAALMWDVTLQKYIVHFGAVPGRGRAIQIARQSNFPADARPTMAATHAALVERFGPPSRQEGQVLHWLLDGSGKPLSSVPRDCTSNSYGTAGLIPHLAMPKADPAELEQLLRQACPIPIQVHAQVISMVDQPKIALGINVTVSAPQLAIEQARQASQLLRNARGRAEQQAVDRADKAGKPSI